MAPDLDWLLAIEKSVVIEGQNSGEVKMHPPGLKMYTVKDGGGTADNRSRAWPLAVDKLRYR
jgi:hypothetical protein